MPPGKTVAPCLFFRLFFFGGYLVDFSASNNSRAGSPHFFAVTFFQISPQELRLLQPFPFRPSRRIRLFFVPAPPLSPFGGRVAPLLLRDVRLGGCWPFAWECAFPLSWFLEWTAVLSPRLCFPLRGSLRLYHTVCRWGCRSSLSMLWFFSPPLLNSRNPSLSCTMNLRLPPASSEWQLAASSCL